MIGILILIFYVSCFSSEKDIYVGYLPLAHVLELVAGTFIFNKMCFV